MEGGVGGVGGVGAGVEGGVEGDVVAEFGGETVLEMGDEVAFLRLVEGRRGCEREGVIDAVVLQGEVNRKGGVLCRFGPAAGKGEDDFGSEIEIKMLVGKSQLDGYADGPRGVFLGEVSDGIIDLEGFSFDVHDGIGVRVIEFVEGSLMAVERSRDPETKDPGRVEGVA